MSKMIGSLRRELIASRAGSPAVYQCIFCGVTFPEKSILSTHLQSHMTSSEPQRQNPLKCPVCPFESWTEAEFERHINNHVTGYKCVFCDFVTLKRSRLRSHLPEHAFERKYRCSICSTAFYSKDLLKRHLKKHGPMTFSCSQCNHKTYSNQLLKEHIRVKHEKRASFKCGDCDAEFKYGANLSCHRRKAHGKLPNSKCGRSNVTRCPDCPYETKRRPEYLFHRLASHDKFPVHRDGSMFYCRAQGCSMVLDDELRFVKHVQLKHTLPSKKALDDTAENHTNPKTRRKPHPEEASGEKS